LTEREGKTSEANRTPGKAAAHPTIGFFRSRPLILRPKLVVADEPVSALDVSIGAQVLLLLQELQRQFGLTCIFISHSLPVVAQLATRIAVMRFGKFVEVGAAEQILRQPAHPYTRELLVAVPELLRA